MTKKISASNGPHEDYLKWKSWGGNGFASVTKNECANFKCEISHANLVGNDSLKVLDIGFGNGSFLAFATNNKWNVTGTEVNPELIKAAEEKGFNVKLSEDLSIFENESFDLVVAFDVLEHIQQKALPSFIEDVRRILKEGGCFIARFPNGDSPFGLYLQNGDITHVTSIGSGKAQYFADKFDLEVLHIGGEAKPILGTSLAHSIHRLIAYPFKLIINLFVNTIIFPKANIAFCSPNITVVYKKKARG